MDLPGTRASIAGRPSASGKIALLPGRIGRPDTHKALLFWDDRDSAALPSARSEHAPPGPNRSDTQSNDFSEAFGLGPDRIAAQPVLTLRQASDVVRSATS